MGKIRQFVNSMKKAYGPTWRFGLEGFTGLTLSFGSYIASYTVSESLKYPDYWQAKTPIIGPILCNPLSWAVVGTAFLIPLIDDTVFNCRLLGYLCHAPDGIWERGKRVVF